MQSKPSRVFLRAAWKEKLEGNNLGWLSLEKNTAQLQKWILSQKGNHRLPNLAYETMSDDVERNQLISTGTLSKLYHVVKPLLGGLFKAIFKGNTNFASMLWEASKSLAWVSLLMKGYHHLGCIFNSEINAELWWMILMLSTSTHISWFQPSETSPRQ